MLPMLPLLLLMVPHTHRLAHPLAQIRHSSDKTQKHKCKTFDDDNGNESPNGMAAGSGVSCEGCMKITI